MSAATNKDAAMKTMNNKHISLLLTLTTTLATLGGCVDPSSSEAEDPLFEEGATTGGEEEPTDEDRTTGVDEPGTTGEDPDAPDASDGSTGGQDPTGGQEPDDPDPTGGQDPTGGEDPIEPDQAPADGDHDDNPAVRAQFRNTAGAPVSVTGPLFNLDDPLDIKGLQYIDEVSTPGDEEDWIQFNIVPGENDPIIEMRLDCDQADLDPQPLRAQLLGPSGDVLETVVCGQGPSTVVLHQAASTDRYDVVVYAHGEHYDAYTLEIDAFCFQECNYQPL